MNRPRFFEWEDLPWFPDTIRRGMLDFLAFFLRLGRLYDPAVPLLKRVLRRTGNTALLDLASGGGGPLEGLWQQLQTPGRPVRIFLSDRFPNSAAYRRLEAATGGVVSGIEAPVDAAAVPARLQGVRTLFSAFHHFPPAAALRMLRDAAEKQAPLIVLDGGGPRLLLALGVLLQPLVFLVATPFLRPFRWSRLVFTYLLPVIPFCTLWDGLVSVWRLYSVRDLKKLSARAQAQGYTWEAGTLPHSSGVAVTYLVGLPTAGLVNA